VEGVEGNAKLCEEFECCIDAAESILHRVASVVKVLEKSLASERISS
jgi:hypothetical protein